MAAAMGRPAPAGRVHPADDGGDGGIQARAVRSARRRIRAGRRLLHRVFGRQAGRLHADRFCRSGAGRGAGDDCSSSADGRCRGSTATASIFPAARLRSRLPNAGRGASRSRRVLVKVVFFCWLQILIRWTLPRFRYDQLMRLGWKGLVPLGLLNLVVTAFVVVASGASTDAALAVHLPGGARRSISALGVVLQRNPVHCLLALVLTLLAIAVLFHRAGRRDGRASCR